MMINQETLTLVLVNFAGIMEKADEALLPAVYKEVGDELHVDPTALGSLTLFLSIVQAACYPLAAYLAVRHNRAHIIALGAFLWAVATFLVAVSSTYLEVAISRGLNGIGLAIVTPAILSLVADSTDENNRGAAFGWLQLTASLGSIIGGLVAVLLASTSFMGIPGWRVSFHLVGLLSVAVGLSVRFFAKDPRFSDIDGTMKDGAQPKSLKEEVDEVLKVSKAVLKVPSFLILVAQGVSGSFPWSALTFTAMWLELMGFSHQTTAFIWTMFQVSQALGGLFGGKMGDVVAKRLPNSGRIMLSQISSGSAIPLAAIIMLGLPSDPPVAVMYGLAFFIMGLIISWNSPATNNPIFAEIVPEKSRTSIYALDRSFESILASFAAPTVGILAQHAFGYKPVEDGAEADKENAAALGKALYTAIGIPMAICCTIYSFLYCTYPRDRDRARMDALIESDVEEENSGAIDEYSPVRVSVFSRPSDEDYEQGLLSHERERGKLYKTSSSYSKVPSNPR